jgi:hypothetical protein
MQQQRPYRERFPVGSRVRIADHAALDKFRTDWQYNNPLTQEQLAYASSESEVQELGFYHGGEVLYQLKNIPGVWHETCLVAAARQ